MIAKRLKRFKPKELTQLFRKSHERAFSYIDCLDCDNRCTSVGYLLDDQDVERIAKTLQIEKREVIATYLREYLPPPISGISINILNRP